MISEKYPGLTLVILGFTCIVTLLLISCRSSQLASTQSSTQQAGEASPTPGVSQSTPQEAVLSYYQAVNEGNPEWMATLFDPKDESNQRFLDAFRRTLDAGTTFELSSLQIYVVDENKKWTRIRTNHHQKMFQDGHLRAEAESGGEYTLIKERNKWYFVGMGDPIRPGWLLDQP